jgi:hypothetical protein
MTSPNGPVSDPLERMRQLWLRQAQPAPQVDAAALRRAARRLRRRVWIRNLTEWGAALLLLPACLQSMLRSDRPLTRVGLAGIALGGLYVSAALYRRGRAGRQPASASTAEFLRAHVLALARQAELLESVWRWYLLPFVPGVALVYLDAALAAWAASRSTPRGTGVWLTLAAAILLTCLVFATIAVLNRRAARDLRREAAALGAPE